jgi:hypothetical protein
MVSMVQNRVLCQDLVVMLVKHDFCYATNIWIFSTVRPDLLRLQAALKCLLIWGGGATLVALDTQTL